MDIEEQYIEDYAEGFSDAAILAYHAPELLSEIEQDNNPKTDYFSGFFAGKGYYEQEMQKELDALNELRSQSKDHDKELERE